MFLLRSPAQPRAVGYLPNSSLCFYPLSSLSYPPSNQQSHSNIKDKQCFQSHSALPSKSVKPSRFPILFYFFFFFNLPLIYSLTIVPFYAFWGHGFSHVLFFCPEVQCKIKYSEVPSSSQLLQIYLTVIEKNLDSKWQDLRGCDVCVTGFIVICMCHSSPDEKHVSLIYQAVFNLRVSFLFHRPIKCT